MNELYAQAIWVFTYLLAACCFAGAFLATVTAALGVRSRSDHQLLPVDRRLGALMIGGCLLFAGWFLLVGMSIKMEVPFRVIALVLGDGIVPLIAYTSTVPTLSLARFAYQEIHRVSLPEQRSVSIL